MTNRKRRRTKTPKKMNPLKRNRKRKRQRRIIRRMRRKTKTKWKTKEDESKEPEAPIEQGTEAKDEDTGASSAFPFEVKALDSYKSSNKEDLSFGKNAVITVEQENVHEGKYYGVLGKKKGWFPCYYVLKM